VKLPLLLVTGGVILKVVVSVVVSGIENELIVLSALFTTREEVILAAVLFSVASWIAVITTVPVPTVVTTFPAIVATNKFELVYEKAPLLLVVGGVSVNVPLPNVVGGITKLLSTVRMSLTWKRAVIESVV